MLGGTAPFYSRPRVDTASSIMRRIKDGDFRFDGDAWKCVSNTAKTLCKGLLTVDPRKRISMDQLHSAPWLSQTTANVNPLAFMYAVTFAASNSYLTPIGYQTNTMVYAPGGYKFLDFTRLGAPLNLILTFLTPSLIVLFYGLK